MKKVCSCLSFRDFILCWIELTMLYQEKDCNDFNDLFDQILDVHSFVDPEIAVSQSLHKEYINHPSIFRRNEKYMQCIS